jgi:hypothetical protein
METKKIIGVNKVKPPREECNQILTMKDIIQGVNAVLNPGKEPIDWFAPASDAVAAVHFKDGNYEPELSNKKVMYGGTVSGQNVENIKVVAYNGNEGGVYVEGAASDVTVDGAVISTAGDGQGIGGPSSAAAVKYNGKLTLKNAVIDTNGRTRYSTAAEEGGVLKVYDSVIYSHGIPYGDDIPAPSALMSTPPPPLEIAGNTRTHCSMSNSTSYFYNSTIICDGWAALSTESSEGYVYLEANDCNIICTKSGYGAYSDPGCHDYFNDCNFDMSNMAAILAGHSDMTFTDCDADCGTYFALTHCVNGWEEEVADLTVTGGTIHTKKEAVLVKRHNAMLDFCDVELTSEAGILVHTIVNDDPCATKVTKPPFGVNVCFTDMDVTGDLIHEDTGRDMWVLLNSTVIRGKIENANVSFDAGSKWIATADSEICLLGETEPAQIDALEGVTVTVHGGENAEYTCLSGGKVVVKM